VRVNGRPQKPSRIVDGPLTVEVDMPAPVLLRAEPEDLPLHVVYEDEAVLVVDKPAPMVVHVGPGHARGTLVGAVLHHLRVQAEALPVLAGNDATRPGIVHRIDKDTSGLLVIAKTPTAQARLAEQFAQHTIDRQYLGIVAGVTSWAHREVRTLHGRDPKDRRRFAPDAGKRHANTDVTVVRRLEGATLCRFTLHTGRTHQIRMHARALGHPILGDALYGRRLPEGPVRAAARTLTRHALHAHVLGFEHPDDGRRVRFVSELPADLLAVVEALRPRHG
jgi:23S rRNA pseudouridine1911/1915/1917 synthase